MESNFSPRVKDVISYSREEALRLGHDYIGVEHLLLGIIREGEGLAVKILKSLGIDMLELRKEIERNLKPGKAIQSTAANIPLVKQAEKVLKITYLEAKLFRNNIIGTEHLLLSILKDEDNIATRILDEHGVNYEVVKDVVEAMNKEVEDDMEDEDIFNPKSEFPSSPSDDDENEKGGFMGSSSRKSDTKSKTPVLDNFGRDLTKMAEEGKLDPIVGREKEIERVSQILSRRKKNNPILIGEPGVGKSAIAEGLALRIVQKKVSRVLFNKRIVTLDLAS